MRRLLVALLFVPTLSSAQLPDFGTITAFADPAGSMCTLADDADKMFNVYVLNIITPGLGLAAVRFKLQASAGFAADYIGETSPFLTYGNSQDGVAVNYLTCYPPGNPLIMTVTYHGHGTSAVCSELSITGHPDSYYPGRPDAMECSFDWWPLRQIGSLLVNSVEGQCNPWCTVAVETTTWGAVKSLYR